MAPPGPTRADGPGPGPAVGALRRRQAGPGPGGPDHAGQRQARSGPGPSQSSASARLGPSQSGARRPARAGPGSRASQSESRVRRRPAGVRPSHVTTVPPASNRDLQFTVTFTVTAVGPPGPRPPSVRAAGGSFRVRPGNPSRAARPCATRPGPAAGRPGLTVTVCHPGGARRRSPGRRMPGGLSQSAGPAGRGPVGRRRAAASATVMPAPRIGRRGPPEPPRRDGRARQQSPAP
jgi:hypothetical protein